MHRAGTFAFVAFLVPAFVLAACEKQPSKLDQAIEQVKEAKAPEPAAEEQPKAPAEPRMPILIVDAQGPMLGGERVDVSKLDWSEKIYAAVAKLPVNGKPVTVAADRQAKTQHVAALVGALGAAGAPEVTVKTQTRDGKEGELLLTPERLVKQTPDCAAVGMVRKDGSTAVWQLKGGTARKFSRGFAGPDLSMTFDEGLSKRIASCAATSWFFSAEDDVVWGLSFDLAEKVTKADPPTKVTTTVLLAEAPVAGRKVTLKE